MNNQAPLRPSSAARRIACPGSYKMEQLYPQLEESEQAREGTLAHECAHTHISYSLSSGCTDFNEINTLHAREMPDRHSLWTQEMLDGAQRYFTLIDVLSGGKHFVQLEQALSIANIHSRCTGTPDCWIVAGNILYVIDYKFGHTPVDAYENPQLLEYAAGAILHWEEYLQHPRIEEVRLIIVQPRDFVTNAKTKHWNISREKAKKYFEKLREAEYLATQDDAPLRVSLLCGTCSARHACPALQKSALEKAEHVMINATRELSPTELANELRYLRHASKILDARITGLSEEALIHLKKGTRLPHLMLESMESREYWTIPTETVIDLGELYSVDLSKPGVLTPRQAIQKGVPEKIIKSISERKLGKPRLTLDDGKKAKRIFNNKGEN